MRMADGLPGRGTDVHAEVEPVWLMALNKDTLQFPREREDGVAFVGVEREEVRLVTARQHQGVPRRERKRIGDGDRVGRLTQPRSLDDQLAKRAGHAIPPITATTRPPA